MSSTPRTWQRPRRGTAAGRARLRQPFRSPLLGTQAAGSQTPAGAQPAAGTPTSTGLRAAARQFRSPLLASRQEGTPPPASRQDGPRTPASEQEGTPPSASRQEGTPPPASRQDGPRTPASEQEGTPPPTDLRTDDPPPGCAASPLLRAAAAASPPADSDVGSVWPSVAAESAAVSPSVEPADSVSAQPAASVSAQHADSAAPQPAASVSAQPAASVTPQPVASVTSPPADCELQAALAAADAELARLEAAGCRAEQLPLFIAALHGYNEAKDAAQMVMGRIAELDGVTVRTVHQRYDELPPAERC